MAVTFFKNQTYVVRWSRLIFGRLPQNTYSQRNPRSWKSFNSTEWSKPIKQSPAIPFNRPMFRFKNKQTNTHTQSKAKHKQKQTRNWLPLEKQSSTKRNSFITIFIYGAICVRTCENEEKASENISEIFFTIAESSFLLILLFSIIFNLNYCQFFLVFTVIFYNKQTNTLTLVLLDS